ncbi:MAG: hypothetical protein ABEI99_07835 [Halobaculum sp.]
MQFLIRSLGAGGTVTVAVAVAATRSLAATTDIPFNRPPKAVERWNSRALDRFPTTGRDTSVYPPSATPTSDGPIRDAHVTIFAVQPSTRARVAPSKQPHYVASEGDLLAVSDYRVTIPEDTDGRWIRTNWTLLNHSHTKTKLLVDDDVERTVDGSQTHRLEYDLEDDPGTEHTLTVRANVTATVQRRTEVCVRANQTSDCLRWITFVGNQTTTVTVSDSVDVTEHRLDVAGYSARYPNGDLGVVVFKNQPWLGFSLPTGRVNGVWRFYTARDPQWDRLVRARAEGTAVVNSSVRPLHVSAYPFKPGPTAAPAETVSILRVYGDEKRPPGLPGTVHLDVLERPYTASYSLAARFRTPSQDVSNVTAHGLVRGVSTDADPRLFDEVPLRRSNLTLSVLNTTNTTATVRVTLRDAKTGAPIDTEDREGYIRLGGERIHTDRDGAVTTTIPRPAGALDARYEPAPWWLHTPSYVSDSDTVTVQGTALRLVQSLYRAGVPIGLFLLAVFLIDRITGMAVWPP